jgi:hypothetical protein
MKRRRTLAPVFERCKASGCDGVRRRSESFCVSCFDRLPREIKRDLASARAERRAVDLSRHVVAAIEWLGSLHESERPEQWWQR